MHFWHIVLATVLMAMTYTVQAGPISFNSALPVSEGVGILRSQVKIMKKSGDSTALNRDLTVTAIPLVLAYGINSKLAVFAVLPYVDKRLAMTLATQRIHRAAQGLGDAKIFARYTIIQQDRPGDTFRIAPFAGLKIPTGAHADHDAFGLLPRALQVGSGSWDVFAGLAITRQTLDWEFDIAPSYQLNTEAAGFEFGAQARLDASLQYRLFPTEITSDTAGFTYAVLESNIIWNGKNKAAAATDLNSGGLSWNLVPGLQYVTARFVLETTLQIPVMQRLNGTALKSDWTWTAGFRTNF